MKYMSKIQLSFSVTVPTASHAILPASTLDGAVYTLVYRYERRGLQWWAVLDRMIETMPPNTPQISSFTDADRLPILDEYGLSTVLEAKQRCKEWADINSMPTLGESTNI